MLPIEIFLARDASHTQVALCFHAEEIMKLYWIKSLNVKKSDWSHSLSTFTIRSRVKCMSCLAKIFEKKIFNFKVFSRYLGKDPVRLTTVDFPKIQLISNKYKLTVSNLD
jgi:hypothetical protein